jgi:hypothetical protein
MATLVSGTDDPILATRQIDLHYEAEYEAYEPQSRALRGFFFAMLFNVFLVFTVAAAWEIWCLTR